jgi:hypothetical protein
MNNVESAAAGDSYNLRHIFLADSWRTPRFFRMATRSVA